MSYFKVMGLFSCVLMLNACSAFQSPFSCNETAADSCLSIAKVHAMADQGFYLKAGREEIVETGEHHDR